MRIRKFSLYTCTWIYGRPLSKRSYLFKKDPEWMSIKLSIGTSIISWSRDLWIGPIWLQTIACKKSKKNPLRFTENPRDCLNLGEKPTRACLREITRLSSVKWIYKTGLFLSSFLSPQLLTLFDGNNVWVHFVDRLNVFVVRIGVMNNTATGLQVDSFVLDKHCSEGNASIHLSVVISQWPTAPA